MVVDNAMAKLECGQKLQRQLLESGVNNKKMASDSLLLPRGTVPSTQVPHLVGPPSQSSLTHQIID